MLPSNKKHRVSPQALQLESIENHSLTLKLQGAFICYISCHEKLGNTKFPISLKYFVCLVPTKSGQKSFNITPKLFVNGSIDVHKPYNCSFGPIITCRKLEHSALILAYYLKGFFSKTLLVQKSNLLFNSFWISVKMSNHMKYILRKNESIHHTAKASVEEVTSSWVQTSSSTRITRIPSWR